MRNFLNILFLLFVFNCFVFAQENRTIQPYKNYKTTLQDLKKTINDVDKNESYKNIVLIDKNTKKEIQFKDLDIFSKNIYVLNQIEKMLDLIYGLDIELNKDLAFLEKNGYTGKVTSEDDNYAYTEDLKEFIKSLNDIKKDTLGKKEEFAKKFFKDFKEIFSETEIKAYFNKINREKEKIK